MAPLPTVAERTLSGAAPGGPARAPPPLPMGWPMACADTSGKERYLQCESDLARAREQRWTRTRRRSSAPYSVNTARRCSGTRPLDAWRRARSSTRAWSCGALTAWPAPCATRWTWRRLERQGCQLASLTEAIDTGTPAARAGARQGVLPPRRWGGLGRRISGRACDLRTGPARPPCLSRRGRCAACSEPCERVHRSGRCSCCCVGRDWPCVTP